MLLKLLIKIYQSCPKALLRKLFQASPTFHAHTHTHTRTYTHTHTHTPLTSQSTGSLMKMKRFQYGSTWITNLMKLSLSSLASPVHFFIAWPIKMQFHESLLDKKHSLFIILSSQSCKQASCMRLFFSVDNTRPWRLVYLFHKPGACSKP